MKSTNSDLNYLGQPYPPSRPSNKRRFSQDERDLPRLCCRDRLATSSRPDPITQLLLYVSPDLHQDLFFCPGWLRSPSRPSTSKISTGREREIYQDSAEEDTRDMCFGHPLLTSRAVDNCNCSACVNLSCLHEEPFIDLQLHEGLREHPSPNEIETVC